MFEHGKSGLRSFFLMILRRTMHDNRVDKVESTKMKPRYYLKIINVIQRERQKRKNKNKNMNKKGKKEEVDEEGNCER